MITFKTEERRLKSLLATIKETHPLLFPQAQDILNNALYTSREDLLENGEEGVAALQKAKNDILNLLKE